HSQGDPGMTTDDFTTAARAEADGRGYDPAYRGRTRNVFLAGAEWARDHLAAQEPTDDDVQAAVAAILALTGETEETARMDDIDVAWDHASAALAAAREARHDVP